jgi:hypothetical protein
VKFRKKPVVVEAIQFVPQTDDPGDSRCGPIQRWALQWDAGEDWLWAPDRVEIPTLEGVMTASVGDWIIRGVKGEFYPCKDDIFRATYDPVEEDK